MRAGRSTTGRWQPEGKPAVGAWPAGVVRRILSWYTFSVAGLAELIETVEGFEWDAGNSEKNWKRHQVTQAECEQVFANLPLLLSVTAKAGEVESRYFALGRTDVARELTVVFTV